MSVELRRADRSELHDVEALLRASGLPTEGVAEHFDTFRVATDGATLVGCVGLERHDGEVLLRSLAVAEPWRGQRLGERLLQRGMDAARLAGATRLFLLTTTAADFFARRGFTVIARAEAPAALSQSRELQDACPSSATMMTARLG